ncbi:thioredoxin-like protein, partial [Fistulina hepatica ATCC 64428]
LSLALGLLSLSPLVSAGLFPSSSHVKMLDPKGFRQAMEANQTSMVAFVAPWCGHCQRMSPEYAKAAQGLHPLVPVYAVDCDDEKNKRLCSEQAPQPKRQLFPRGNEAPPMTYSSGERTASAFFDWASRRVPHKISRLKQASEIPPWTEKNVDKPRALLLTKDTKMPLLWKVLGNKYRKVIEFGTHRDIDGETSVAMGYEAGSEKQAKVLLYPVGSTKPARYTGKNKLDSLSAFFDSVLDGTAD